MAPAMRVIEVNITPLCKKDPDRHKKLRFPPGNEAVVTIVDCHPRCDHGVSVDIDLDESFLDEAGTARLPSIFHTFARNFGLESEELRELILRYAPRTQPP